MLVKTLAMAVALLLTACSREPITHSPTVVGYTLTGWEIYRTEPDEYGVVCYWRRDTANTLSCVLAKEKQQ